MRSPFCSDTWFGLAVVTALLAAAGWVVVVINSHAEEHGHCSPVATVDVERAKWMQSDGGGEGENVGHARQPGCIVEVRA